MIGVYVPWPAPPKPNAQAASTQPMTKPIATRYEERMRFENKDSINPTTNY